MLLLSPNCRACAPSSLGLRPARSAGCGPAPRGALTLARARSQQLLASSPQQRMKTSPRACVVTARSNAAGPPAAAEPPASAAAAAAAADAASSSSRSSAAAARSKDRSGRAVELMAAALRADPTVLASLRHDPEGDSLALLRSVLAQQGAALALLRLELARQAARTRKLEARVARGLSSQGGGGGGANGSRGGGKGGRNEAGGPDGAGGGSSSSRPWSPTDPLLAVLAVPLLLAAEAAGMVLVMDYIDRWARQLNSPYSPSPS